MNNLKSIIIGILLAVGILFASVVTISIIYEEEVSQYLVEELNKYIHSKIEVEDLNFSLLKKFPSASLELKNVVAFSKEGYLKKINGYKTDTLFYAKSIYIQLNIKDILSKNYNITRIHFDRSSFNLFVDRFGDPNYIFWDTPSESSSDEFSFELKEVKITNSEIFYYNEATDFLVTGEIDKIDFEGNFSKQNYLMKIKSKLFVKSLSVNQSIFIENKSVSTNLRLDIINDIIQFKDGDLELQNLTFNLNGNVSRLENHEMDILISGKELGIKQVINNLPEVVKKEFPSIFGQTGVLTIKLNISSKNIRTSRPHINAMFIVNNAQLFDESRGIQLNNIQIDGEFDNGIDNGAETTTVLFKNFSVEIGRNWFKGNCKLHNLSDPLLNLKFDSELNFEDIKNQLKLDTLETFNGHATASVNYSGTYKELRSFTFSQLFTKDFSINLKVSDGEIKIKNKPIVVKEISGKFDLNRSLVADSMIFKIGENDFLINGRISKLFEYLNDSEMFNINASLYSRKVDLNELAMLFRVDKTENTESVYKFPDKLALQLKLDIENFEVGKFSATNVKGNLNYKPKMFSLHEISFNSMNGSVKAGGVIVQNFDNNFLVKTQSRFNKINISNMFYSFNNFGQSFITNKNLNGNLTGDVYFTSEWSDKLEIYKKTVSSDCDFIISEGELNNFEPMMGLSKFIDIDELKKVKFSSLKNKISIEDEKIIIPQMDIESSVLNLTASGEHNFDNSYSYHTKLLLSDLLSGKMKKSKQNSNDSENIEEDNQGRVTLYLLIEGDKDDMKIKYDRKAARVVRKEKMKAEKEDLKRILNEEFGWFKNDTSLNKTSVKDDKFQIEFEETPKKKEPVKNENDKKFIIEWEEDTTGHR